MALAIVVAEKPSAADAAFVDSYTREEAAAILDVSTVTIRSYVKQGRLLSVDDRHVVDRRERRVTKASVEAFRPREQRQTTGTRVFLKDVRPDLRHWIMSVTDTEFDQIAANSKDAFTFFCTNGHTVQAKPRDYRYVTECAYCTGARIWPGYNDLATRWPAFVQDHWDYERNTLGPSEIGTGYNGKVWLRCDLGHDAHAGLAGRFKSWMDGLFSCDKCRVRIRAIRSGQGLTATHPHLVQQWDSRNELHPWEVMPGSGYRASWVCALGHRWRESVSARARCGMGCPYCSGRRLGGVH